MTAKMEKHLMAWQHARPVSSSEIVEKGLNTLVLSSSLVKGKTSSVSHRDTLCLPLPLHRTHKHKFMHTSHSLHALPVSLAAVLGAQRGHMTYLAV